MAEIQTLVKRASTVRDLVTKYIPEIKKAIPRGIDAARFARIALTMLPGNPKLLECDPKTLLGGILQAAAWGLELDPVLGMAYLIPYKDKAQIIIGYQGLITLARRSGEVKNIIPQSVYEKDEFVYELGLNPKLVHKPSSNPDRGNLIGVYAVATMREGPREFRFMWKYEVDAIRARSRAATSGPWVTDYEAMAWKTVIRRLCKYLPRTVELAKAIEMDEKVDNGIEQDLQEALLPTIDVLPPDDGKTSLDKLAGALPASTASTPVCVVPPQPAEPPKTARPPATATLDPLAAVEQQINRDVDRQIAQDIEAAMGGEPAAPSVDPRTPTPAPPAVKDAVNYDALPPAPHRAHKMEKPAMPAAGDIFAPPTREREPGQEG